MSINSIGQIVGHNQGPSYEKGRIKASSRSIYHKGELIFKLT